MPIRKEDTPPSGTPDPSSGQGGMGTGTKAVLALLVLLLLGAGGAAGFYYKQLDDIKKNPNKLTEDETKATIDAVGKLIVLPEGEQPTLATVSDPEKLKDQPFFAHAKVGDKVLIFTNAKKAILYNPTENKIVDVAPVNIGDNSQSQSQVSGSATDKTETTKNPVTTTPKKK